MLYALNFYENLIEEEGIIRIGMLLGEDIVAEGVETDEQVTALLKHECRAAQGYLYSRPHSPSDLEAFVSYYKSRVLA